ncbi:hypothetical protein MXD62_10500, partial [Frankia sp. Mgl5]
MTVLELMAPIALATQQIPASMAPTGLTVSLTGPQAGLATAQCQVDMAPTGLAATTTVLMDGDST